MAAFGLIGKSLSHSFSAAYFQTKFASLGLPHTYSLFELAAINDLPEMLSNFPDLVGFNITIPYKKEVLAFAKKIDSTAHQVGATNVMAKGADGAWTAYNTDILGFRDSLLAWLNELGRPLPTSAWVFGNGGASQAVQAALLGIGIPFVVFARQYGVDLAGNLFRPYSEAEELPLGQLWVQTTPLGQYPGPAETQPLPFWRLGQDNLAYDLVYNPTNTAFMQAAAAQGTPTLSGLRMLHAQAEAAWEIWCSHSPQLLSKG
jgi:shikimate dehydrogenase